jgi:hypothetical protein
MDSNNSSGIKTLQGEDTYVNNLLFGRKDRSGIII